MRLTDIILAIIALVFAFYLIGIILALTFFAIRIVVVLIVAYVVYLFLKKLL